MSVHLPLEPSMSRALEQIPRVAPKKKAAPAWSLAAFNGRFGEISGEYSTAALTLAFGLVIEAQRQGQPVAWITRQESVFYPPDAAETAVDLAALIVVRVSSTRLAARAADLLVRSGGFGLVVLDLGPGARTAPPVLSRLGGLAKKHQAAVVCLTEKGGEKPSLGSLVSIRAEATRAKHNEDRFFCRAHVLKDKRRGPGWKHEEVCHGPDGLC